MMNINYMKAGIGAGLLFVAYKNMLKNKTANGAVLAVGAITLAKSLPVANQYVG